MSVKITALEAENVKRIKAVALTPSQLLTATAYLMAAPTLSAILSHFFRKKQA